MNTDVEELRVVRQLLQEALARAEKAEAECQQLRSRPMDFALGLFEAQAREIKAILTDLESACRELANLGGGRGR